MAIAIDGADLISKGCPANVVSDLDVAFAKIEGGATFSWTALLTLLKDLATQNWAAIPQDIINLFTGTTHTLTATS